jgi:preprotein translocase subunit SecF
MLELLPSGLHLDFIGKAKFYIALSLLVILAGLGSMVWRGGLNLGIDFRGGTQLQLRFSQPVELKVVRDVLGPLASDRPSYSTLAIDIIRNNGFEFHSKVWSRNVVLKLWRPHAISIA